MSENMSQPPMPQPVPQEMVTSPKEKPSIMRSFSMIVILFIVMIGIGAGSYYLGVKNTTKSTLLVVPSHIPTPMLTASPTPDITQSWKVYTNNLYSYSVKYPQNFMFSESNTPYHYVTFSVTEQANGAARLPTFLVSVIPATFIAKDIAAYNYMSSDWIDALYSLQNGGSKTTTSGAIFTKTADTTIAGLSGITVDVSATGYKQRRVYVKNKGNIYMISYYYQPTDDLTILNDFISSFKFTK